MTVTAGEVCFVIVLILLVLALLWLVLRGPRLKEPVHAEYEGTEWKEIGRSLGHHKP
jgi:hypothetical protein